MAQKPKIALIISSTRETRFADKPAEWLFAKMQARSDFDSEILDLRDFNLPFFNEAASNLWVESQDPNAKRWQQALARFDGYIFLVAEYNRSMTGALKNALDQAYVEWVRKPMAAFGYGSIGAARAIEHLRTSAIELQMHPCRFGVHIGGSDFFKVHPLGQNGPISEIEQVIAPATEAMFDDVVWWASALKAARLEVAADD
ncbi:NAD(P)H-dependent oxidoreductase [Pelagibacterium sp. H642]|uniref:NADPH-dependent FMN reductase n=1 Tax=Pelagibacterium sp. H642 TaxID=1881069 RepID=UPI0028153554|nr:NAD(P)H-dependent oxidoreductase [Pelagibacterium sp. H642]WMT92742.1 NAD(P)H-dependent oxidoreductase [Pelagibacterium sp. H642]